MNTKNRIEQALEAALAANEGVGCPPKLAAAIRHAVFPGGARIRPQLCIAVAMANGDTDPGLADAAASAIELIHCASLVHDDLPCFDDAPLRRGQPSVHKAFGERLAVLSGDALIVTAFQTLGAAGGRHPERMARVLQTVAQGVGTPTGIIAGQAWECEPRVALSDYQRAKTGALFAAATAAGAQASGGDGETWRALGDWLGEAYQVADDLRDALADPEQLGKPVGRDVVLGRPSSAIQHGLVGAVEHFERLVQGAIDAIPSCKGAGMLRQMVRLEAERLVPKAWCANIEELAERAAVRAASPTQTA
ncbi:geranylgeranyl pyrophosphate synthase [Rubrivivax gelatinosus]|uniref:Geranylgeranyl pyrophosphate synthase n=1 Tax=Rubrivivax gelatinosus TaxID=28068 RepID=A0ABS1DP16_RUBGE|nr:polyprenyl synthetase family protein [Rubrivivax gelatinosus]MBK1612492.1 geranylgeranyl pyrophosphate synthase [Rubrivivax gelatinosus]MBK1711757.1 geranylgeranyl pyrophosphate synthase [Rubrivivax gelatinosus]